MMSSAASSDDVLRKRLVALRAAAALPPLSLVICASADQLVRDLCDEISEQCLREATPLVPLSETAKALLEGASGTLPYEGKSISASLHQVLDQEARSLALSSKHALSALGDAEARRQATSLGLDVFGNRPKEKANAETIVCTNCAVSLSASRFAPHLERCMLGKGRKRTKVSDGAG